MTSHWNCRQFGMWTDHVLKYRFTENVLIFNRVCCTISIHGITQITKWTLEFLGWSEIPPWTTVSTVHTSYSSHYHCKLIKFRLAHLYVKTIQVCIRTRKIPCQSLQTEREISEAFESQIYCTKNWFSSRKENRLRNCEFYALPVAELLIQAHIFPAMVQ